MDVREWMRRESIAASLKDWAQRDEGIPLAGVVGSKVIPFPKADTAESGKKYDDGKERFDLIPAGPLWEVVRVFTFGARKYSDRNWEKGIAWGRLFAAASRHMWRWWMGEKRDAESGLHPLAHAIASLMMLIEFEEKRPDFDDRPLGD